jgi:flagellin-like protein
MKFGYEHEEAVSPVIGVILMVAITVILAATVGVFVLGMGSDMKGPKEVVIVASTNASGTSVTLQGGKDLSQLEKIMFKVNGATKTSGIYKNTTEAKTDGGINPFDNGYLKANLTKTTPKTFAVGDVIYLDTVKTGSLLVTGKFSDGEEKVLLQKTL